MKRYEKESLLKNFLVFFSLLLSLLVLLFIELYSTKKREYKQDIFKTMQVCNYTMDCKQFSYNFVDKNISKRNTLFEEHGLHSYFSIPKSKKYDIQLSYPVDTYKQDIDAIKHTLWLKFILAGILLSLLSLFFTFYSLRPIRKALQLNDEFLKDILHDFNTPITSMVLNIKMYTQDQGTNIYIKRISQGIKSIVLLQNNLKCFLQQSAMHHTDVDIAQLVKESSQAIQPSYPKLTFNYIKHNDLICISNPELLIRIFDNLLSNACKYNRPHGTVSITIHGTQISIKDTGKGIKNTHNVMQRYYKEQDRGLGLGLHIVQKLLDELDIEMDIQSKLDEGSTFILDFKHLKKAQR